MALTPSASEAGFTGELVDYLYEAYAIMPAAKRYRARWIMNVEWLRECLKINTGHSFLPLRSMGAPITILGLPIEIRDDGGAPHLEEEVV